MSYTNPPVDEQVNLPQEHPLWEFSWMLVAVGVLVVVLVLGITFGTHWLIRYVPIEYEARLVKVSGLLDAVEEASAPVDASSEQTRRVRVEQYLQGLADRLIASNERSPAPTVRVHLVATESVNAFATLGGNIFIHQGLLDQLQTEQGLAMVLGHEIAHIDHRDPITTLGRELAFRVALTLLTGIAEQGTAGYLVETTGGSLLLNFSREQERAADEAALDNLVELYGHPFGSSEFFDYIATSEAVDGAGVPVFLQTHPGVQERQAYIESYAARYEPQAAPLTDLPPYLRSPSP